MDSGDSDIKKILLISLSNVGDVILTFPVIDAIKEAFPYARLCVVVGPKAEALFRHNPYISQTYVFDKSESVIYKFSWVVDLFKQRFDLVIDLRNTAIPFLIFPKYRTPLEALKKSNSLHRKEKHLARLRTIVDFQGEAQKKIALHIDEKSVQHIDSILKGHLNEKQRLIVVSPGAASHIKRWTRDGFAEVCERLAAHYDARVVLVGDKNDQEFIATILWKATTNKPLDFSGQTTLLQLAELLQRSCLVIANDSAVMHMASYLDIPVVAVFGPTDPNKYGPWSSRSRVVRAQVKCAPCEKPACSETHECMKRITVDDVLAAAHAFLAQPAAEAP